MKAAAVLMGIGGLFGAAGVAGAAYAAHAGADARLAGIAAGILLVHGPALLALAGLAVRIPKTAGIVGAGLTIGVALFAGDLASRVFTGGRLFPDAAPAGGMILIAGWLVAAVAGAAALWRAPRNQV